MLCISDFLDCFDDGKEYKMNIVFDQDDQTTTGSEQECQKKCKGVFHCQFWTWNKETGICEYKNVTEGMIPIPVPNLQVVSGPKSCSTYYYLIFTQKSLVF